MPTAQNDALQEETVIGADAEEELLESDGVLEFQGLAVKDRDGLSIDGLTDAQDGGSEVCDVLVIGLVDGLQEHLPSMAGLVLFVQETTSNYLTTCVTLGKESEGVGILLEEELVDHEADLSWELHERKSSISARLRLRLRLIDARFALGLDVLLMTRSTTVRSFDSELYLPDGGR